MHSKIKDKIHDIELYAEKLCTDGDCMSDNDYRGKGNLLTTTTSSSNPLSWLFEANSGGSGSSSLNPGAVGAD